MAAKILRLRGRTLEEIATLNIHDEITSTLLAGLNVGVSAIFNL